MKTTYPLSARLSMRPVTPKFSERSIFRMRAAAVLAVGWSLMSYTSVMGQSAFPQDVASGDVTDSSAMLWTRMPDGGAVRIEVASDDGFANIVESASGTADAATDFTIKHDVTGLTPATMYFYRFIREATGEVSPVGQFKTAPAADGDAQFRFVYSGDSNAAQRPFRILKFAADENPDLWFWAGDTIYGDSPAGDLTIATDLDGYHAKHRQNREDPFLRNLLARSAVWSQWDDHEVANDYDGGDIEPEIGQARMIAGQQAFFDYMPVRTQGVADDPRRIYRSFRYGSLAEFFVLDCRQYRSADLSRAGGGPDPYGFLLPLYQSDIIARLKDPSRTMLGKPQLEWLKQSLKNSTAKWKFVLSSVTFTSLLALPYDRWDGYAAERYDLLRFIDTENITGVVILAADIHADIYNPDVTQLGRNRFGEVYSPCFAVPEFVAGPIGETTFRQEVGEIGSLIFGQDSGEFGGSLFFNALFGLTALRIIDENKLRYLEMDRYAYLVVDVKPEGVTFTHKVVPSNSTIDSPVPETQNTVTLTGEPPGACAPGLPLPICLCLAVLLCAPLRLVSRITKRLKQYSRSIT